MHTDVVEQHQFVTLNGNGTPVFSRWTYVAGDPYVVTLAFRTERGHWIDWSFARDLLIDGLEEPAGLGDVRVRPDLAFTDDMLVIELESPDGYGIVEMRRQDVERFVDATCQVVAPGTETDLLDIDAFIAQVIKV
ncbi:SsgA family sporulation/cell division regulator [Amycolatopsis pithecellobii]|uniref:SsgA family sporulation/cell division regulator n=1 Tax=Amycolatopsis pithecellobii TaxID=664692 RepID=A0A6N7Z8T6_9PSEU|nr:SsgA family sporulation/cell division regulator [Amycolatopsis pithecellobii]MTD57086.1 SsgA family sporulation/cell division regulator [Amycolatopsis pithecellobii]